MSARSRTGRMLPAERKARLVEATLRCLEQHGFQGSSIRRICAEAGVSIGLINHHYAGKDALVAEAYQTIQRRVMTVLHAAVDAAAPSGRSRLSAFFHASFTPDILDPNLLGAWSAFWGGANASEAISAVHHESNEEYRGILAGGLSLLAQENGWQGFDVVMAAIALSALLDGLWLEYELNPRTFTPAQGIQMCEAWVDGLVAGGYRRFCS